MDGSAILAWSSSIRLPSFRVYKYLKGGLANSIEMDNDSILYMEFCGHMGWFSY